MHGTVVDGNGVFFFSFFSFFFFPHGEHWSTPASRQSRLVMQSRKKKFAANTHNLSRETGPMGVIKICDA